MPAPAAVFALDRSLRRYDVDGRLHVSDCCISKANVCPYYGREIPNSEALGLDPNRLYQLYRDPAELEAAAPSFANMPLMLHHVGVNADNTPKELIVGTIGSDVRFEAPYLIADLAVWTADGIEAVETGDQRELSCGYRYRVDMTPGIVDGVAYDGVMRDIKANHVALVRVGRAGPDVLVHDELPPGVIQMKSRFLTALLSILKVTPTQDQRVALDAAYDSEVKGNDTEVELSADEMKAACDEHAKELGKDASALSDEEKEDAYKRAAKDKKAKDEHAAESERKTAQDSAIRIAVDEALKGRATDAQVTERVNSAVATALAAERALVSARAAVEPLVGEVTCDSAEAVYRFALDKVGTDHKGVHADALPALVKTAVDKKGTAAAADRIAADQAADAATSAAFPGLSRFSRR